MAENNMVAEESSLSSWVGPYVSQMLGRGAALSNMPYTAYEGPLTAGPSALQTQAYQGLGALQVPTTAGSFTGAAYALPTAEQMAAGQPGTYTPASGNVAQQYMTPYLQAVLAPQVAAARRQADISQQNLQSQYGKAGAYGGSRQGVAAAELQRGLLDRLSGIYGTGYQNAFQQAQDQFNKERQYGLDVLGEQRTAGTEQRNIEQQGILADIAQFEQERDYPMQQLKFMQSLLGGALPLETQTYSYYEPSGLQSLTSTGSDILSLLRDFNLLGSNTSTKTAEQTPEQKATVRALIDALSKPMGAASGY